MWKLIFNAVTNRGIDCNRDPKEGEYAKDIHPSLCGWFNVNPTHYMWDGEKLAEWPGLDAELFEDEKVRVQKANKATCEAHILAKYPLTVQSSMSLGVYPADQKATMVNFIADCIAEENRVFDLAAAVVTQEELASIIPSFPEV